MAAAVLEIARDLPAWRASCREQAQKFSADIWVDKVPGFVQAGDGIIIAATLCFILDEGHRHCLMLCRRREPHKGQWNAPGGKVREGETPPRLAAGKYGKRRAWTWRTCRPMGSVDCLDLGDPANAWRLYLFLGCSPRVPGGGPGGRAFCLVGPGRRSGWGPGIRPQHSLHSFPLVARAGHSRVFDYRDNFLERYYISLNTESRGLPI